MWTWELFVAGAILLLPATAAVGQSKYGLSCYGQDACAVADKKAADRMADAKSICASGDTAIQYPQKNKPSPTTMRTYWDHIEAAQTSAVLGYRRVYDCSKADLILKITLDVLFENVSLEVTDGDSGEAVFTEKRSIQDTRSDLIRAAKHFHDAVANARATARAEEEQAEAKLRAYQEQMNRDREERQFFASLPSNWRYPEHCAVGSLRCLDPHTVRIRINGDTLSEEGDNLISRFPSGHVRYRRDTTCSVTRATSDRSSWSGTCTYKFFWNKTATAGMGAETFDSEPTCTVTTAELVTSIRANEIVGRSQAIDFSPVSETPSRCPIPGTAYHEFTLVPDTEPK